MATSGNTIYQLTRNEILEAAFGVLAVLAQGQTPSSEDYTIGSKMLNTTIARLRPSGLPLWARASYSWTPVLSSYTIGEGKTLDTPYPLRLIQAYRTTSDGAKIPIDIEADYDFNTYPGTTSGNNLPFKITYQPLVNYGIIKFWPTSLTNNTEAVTIIYTRPLEYFDISTDTMDLPEEWYDAIIWDVAAKLAPRWGIPIEDRRELKAEAKAFLSQAMDSGFEETSLFLAPDRRY